VFLSFRRAGQPPVRVRLGLRGGFALHLAPGRYVLALAPAESGAHIVPAFVQVPARGVLSVAVRVVRAGMQPQS
jgi:hypothetical protein